MVSDREYKTWGRSRSNRLSGYDYSVDRPIHAILCTEKKQELFGPQDNARIVINELLKSTQDLRFRMLCYCLMPDHLHVVLSPGNSTYPFSRWLNVFKGRTATILRKKGGFKKVWQRSAFDHIVRADEDLRSIVEYVMNNPVRKGIVEIGDHYPYGALFDVEIERYI